MPTMISSNLLEALLSPDGGIRSQAETVFHAMTVTERIQGLLGQLQHRSSTTTTTNDPQQQQQQQQQHSTRHLAAVLLRRDILKLTDRTLLQQLVPPLLQIFQHHGSSTTTRTHLGHCLAEVCACLSLLTMEQNKQHPEHNTNPDEDGVLATTMQLILASMVESGTSSRDASMDTASIKVLSQLADRAPVAFTRYAVPSIPNLFVQYMQQQQQQQQSNTNTDHMHTRMGVWTELLCNSAMATTVTKVEYIRSSSTDRDRDDLVVETNSAAAVLGTTCVQTGILPWLLSSSSSSSSSTNSGCSTAATAIVTSSLQQLAEAAVTCPSLLAATPHLFEATIQMCLAFVGDTNTTNTGGGSGSTSSTELRLAAMEVLSSLVSVGDIKRRVMSGETASRIATQVLPVCAQLMIEDTNAAEEEVTEWMTEPATLVTDGMDEEGGMDEEDFVFAESLVGSFLQHLGAVALTQVALPLVEQLLSSSSSTDPASSNLSSSWRHVHTGLAILECAVEAVPVSIASYQDIIINCATSFAATTGGVNNNNNNTTTTMNNARVQYRAIRLLGVLCEATNNNLDVAAAPRILERLAEAVAHPCTKISATASLSLVSYTRSIQNTNKNDDDGDDNTATNNNDVQTMVVPFLSELLTALVRGPLSLPGTDTGSVTTKVRAMGATACLATSVGAEAFGPYYATIMPGLLAMAQQPIVDLASAAVEAATIVGQAVGKEMFQNDAHQLLQWIIPTLSVENPLEQVLLSCARIASVLEEDFAMYAGAVVPILLQQAQQPPDVSITEGGDQGSLNPQDAEDDSTDSMTVTVPGRGLVKVTINTIAMEEKAQAARAVYELSRAMGASFSEWLQPSMDVFLPLVSFEYSADVRSTAAQTLSAIYDAACAHGEQTGNMQLPQHYLPLLSKAISNQVVQESPTDLENLYALGDSLSEVFYIVSRYPTYRSDLLAKYTMTNAKESVDACLAAFKLCLHRRAKITRVLAGQLTGEDEMEEYKDLLLQEENLLTPIVDSLGYNLKFFRHEFLPLFDQKIVPVIAPYLASLSDVRSTIAAMLLFDDCVEHCGPEAAATYAPQLLQGILLAFSSSDEKDLIQGAVYGVMQIARKAPNAISMDNFMVIVQKLLQLTSRRKEAESNNEYLLEISCSALASLTLFGRFSDVKCIPRETLLQSFVAQLPIQQDDDEAKVCHAQFCTLFDTDSATLLSPAYVPHMIHIIATILSDVDNDEDVATPETIERFKTILFQMEQSVPASTLQQAFGALDGDTQNIVNIAIGEAAHSRSNLITP